jgi:hypothetical protein
MKIIMKIKMKHFYEFIIVLILTINLTGFNSLSTKKRRKNFSNLLSEYKSFKEKIKVK